MPIAFKEWAVTVRALAEGEQLLTLRKGGIREPDKHFKLEYERFFLYPTFDHQCSELVRESHQPELVRALELEVSAHHRTDDRKSRRCGIEGSCVTWKLWVGTNQTKPYLSTHPY